MRYARAHPSRDSLLLSAGVCVIIATIGVCAWLFDLDRPRVDTDLPSYPSAYNVTKRFMDESAVNDLTFETPDSSATIYQFYAEWLRQRGWRENPFRTDAHPTTYAFEAIHQLEAHYLSLAIEPLPTGASRVTFQYRYFLG